MTTGKSAKECVLAAAHYSKGSRGGDLAKVFTDKPGAHATIVNIDGSVRVARTNRSCLFVRPCKPAGGFERGDIAERPACRNRPAV